MTDLPDWLLTPALLELRRRDEAIAHPAHYARRVVGLIPALHHKLILDALVDLVIHDLYDDIVICTPPGSAKSSYASHVVPSWYMGTFPANNIIIASHTATLAEQWSRKVRDTISTDAHVQLFPQSVINPDMASVTRWATMRGGQCLAAGAGMSILGFRADLVIADDIVSGWEQAQSITQMMKLHAWFDSDVKSRLKPHGKRVIINQRLSANDIAGYVIKQFDENPTRRLKVIKLPMEATGPDDLLGRAPGERLWPDYFTEEMVLDLKRDELIWQTMYQQEPPSEDGSWVSPDEIEILDIVPSADKLKHYLLTDLALSVNNGDYSVHFAAGIDDGGHVYVVDAWRERTSPDVTAARHLALCETYKPIESLIDDDNAAKVYVQLLASQSRSSGIAVPWKMVPMRGQDKETRAAPLRGMFKRKMISFKRADWNRWLVKEILSFPNATGQGVDDGIDALGLLGRRLASLARSSPALEAPKPIMANAITMDQAWECTPSMKTRRI